MRGIYYDNTNRTFKLITKQTRLGLLRFHVKFERGTSSAREVLNFPSEEPITLYENHHRSHIAGVICVERVQFKLGNRSAIVGASIISLQPRSSLRRY